MRWPWRAHGLRQPVALGGSGCGACARLQSRVLAVLSGFHPVCTQLRGESEVYVCVLGAQIPVLFSEPLPCGVGGSPSLALSPLDSLHTDACPVPSRYPLSWCLWPERQCFYQSCSHRCTLGHAMGKVRGRHRGLVLCDFPLSVPPVPELKGCFCICLDFAVWSVGVEGGCAECL